MPPHPLTLPLAPDLEARQDHGTPTVAFVPLVEVASCSGPVHVVFFRSGSFDDADRRISISIASTSRANPRVEATIASNVDVLRRQVVTWSQVTLPAGEYVLNGTAVSALARTVFIPSVFFAVLEGDDTSCLGPTSSTTTSNPPLTPPISDSTTTHASLSSDAPPQTLQSSSSLITADPSAPTTPQLHGSESTTASTTATTSSERAVIAASIAGSLLFLLLLLLLAWLCRRRRPRSHRDEKMPPGWKRISAIERSATATSLNKPQRRTTTRKPPHLNLAVVPPDPGDEKAERPAVMVQVTRHSAEAAGLGAQSMYLNVPAHVTYTALGSRSTAPSLIPLDGDQSRADSRVTVGSSRWGWVVPITPLFNLVMSRRSSAGSSRFLSPGGALETPRPDRIGQGFPVSGPPRVSSDRQSERSSTSEHAAEMSLRSGGAKRTTAGSNAYSLSDFPWATPQRSRAPSQTLSSFNLNFDVASDRSAPALAPALDSLPEIPGEDIGCGSGSETETEGTPRKPRVALLTRRL